MNEVLMGVIAGLKLAVFSSLAVFIYMTQTSNESLDVSKFYYLSAAFVLMAVVESIYVISLAQGGLPILEFLTDFENVEIIMESLYIIAALSVIVFLREFGSSGEQ